MRKGNNTKNADEERRMVAAYVKAIDRMVPLASPDAFRQVVRKLTDEPEPVDVFKDGEIPGYLQRLWLDARIARDRYLTALGNEVLMQEPLIKRFKSEAA